MHKFEGGINTRTEKAEYKVAALPEGLTLAEAVRKYEVILAHFKQSTNCADISAFFENVLLQLPSSFHLSCCICTGLGTFTAAHPYCSKVPEPSLYQLAAIEIILEILSKWFFGFFGFQAQMYILLFPTISKIK